MPPRQIIAAIVIAIIALVVIRVAFKHFFKPSKKRRSKGGKARESDQRRLNRHERNAYTQAIELHKRGKSIPAAQLLESIGMMRECINVLESSGNIKEAAATLMRMQKPNRAGVILARHKKWSEAASCFTAAQMPLEAAKCYKECEQFENAAENFSKAQRFEDAAECYVEVGQFSHAASIFAKLNTREKYVDAMKQLYRKEKSFADHEFDNNQIEIIESHFGNENEEFFDPLLQAFKEPEDMARLILTLLDQGRLEPARRAHIAFNFKCDDELLINVNYVKDQAPMLAKLLKENERYLKAAGVFSRLESFAEAGECFELAGDLSAARSAYDKAGMSEKVKELKKKKIKMGKNAPTPPPPSRPVTPIAGKANPFSLGAIEDSGTGTGTGLGSAEEAFSSEKTELLDGAESMKDKDFSVNKFDEDGDDTKIIFQRLEFLDELTRADKDKIWTLGNQRKFNEGQEVLGINEEPEGIVFVLRGELQIEISDNGQMAPLKVLESTESFGESWVLADQDSPFRVVAKSASQVFIIAKEDLVELMEANGEMALCLYKKYTQSLIARMVTHQNHNENKFAS